MAQFRCRKSCRLGFRKEACEMPGLKEKYNRFTEHIRTAVVSDEQRRGMVYFWINLLFCVVAGLMSVVNIFTAKWLLLGATLSFCAACLVNILLLRRNGKYQKLAWTLFLTESMLLCCFFCISGMPEGFSALWICFIPTLSFTLMGIRNGGRYSALGLAMLILIFWTPFGRGLLQYQYTDSFLLRFPMIYAAFFLLSMFVEFVRAETHRQLRQAEQRYLYLYQHDPLTGVLNRYVFNERLDDLLRAEEQKRVTLMILDLDHFKHVNDTFGHDAGDCALRAVAGDVRKLVGDRGEVCRWGGEEFTVLLQQAENPEQLAEQICAQVAATAIRVGTDEIHVTLTIGVCTTENLRQVGIARFVRKADECLYEGKAAGRNRVTAARM